MKYIKYFYSKMIFRNRYFRNICSIMRDMVNSFILFMSLYVKTSYSLGMNLYSYAFVPFIELIKLIHQTFIEP